MVNLDELEELLRSGKDEEAYKQIKGDRCITAEILINDAIFFGTLGDYSISISYFELAEKIAEDDEVIERVRKNLAVSYNNRGTTYDGLKKHEKAIEDYNKAIALNPEDAMAYYNRGTAYAKLKKHEEAIEDYNKAIALDPEYAMAYNNRGNAYNELKKHEKAIEDYNKAIALNPEDAMGYYNRGNAYDGLKKHEEAIEDYNKAIALDPEDAMAYYNRGIAYDGLKKHEKAIEDYNKAIALDPEYATAYNNCGTAYAKLKKHEEAIEDYNKAIALDPEYAMAYYNRGNAYDGLKKHEKAIEDYNKAIALNPEYAMAYNNRGNAYDGLKKHEKAIEDYNKAIALDPEYAMAYYNRGNAYDGLKKHEKAIEDYNKAIALDPEYAMAYNNRGTAYYKLKKHEKAIEDYNKAIALNPEDATAYANRGIARLLSNDHLYKAIADFKFARDFFEGKDKERMLGFKEWVEARNAVNMKNWNGFRERMNEAKGYFDTINDPLSHSLDAFMKFSYLDEELDQALSSSDPMEASEKIETALKNLPEVEGLIGPERTIFNARISSFALVSEFISSIRGIDDNTDLGKVKDELAKLHNESKEVEMLFESVNFDAGKTTIVNMQRIISSVKQEIEEIKWAANRKQTALDILIKYWSRVSGSIQALNGILTRKTENIALERRIETMGSKMDDQFAETKEIITEGFKRSGKVHKEILEKICETQNILLQKDIVNTRYRIEIQAPLISSLSPISPKIIVDIPMGNLTEEQIKGKAEEIIRKIKCVKEELQETVKREFLDVITRIPVIGKKILKRLEKTAN